MLNCLIPSYFPFFKKTLTEDIIDCMDDPAVANCELCESSADPMLVITL